MKKPKSGCRKLPGGVFCQLGSLDLRRESLFEQVSQFAGCNAHAKASKSVRFPEGRKPNNPVCRYRKALPGWVTSPPAVAKLGFATYPLGLALPLRDFESSESAPPHLKGKVFVMPKRYVPWVVIVACLTSWVGSQSVRGQDPAAAGPAVAAAVGRWQIFRADLAQTSTMVGNQQRSQFSTILIDTVTGDSWMLWPSDAGGKQTYVWAPIGRSQPNQAAAAFPALPIGAPPAAK
jgi:hypothetical protein